MKAALETIIDWFIYGGLRLAEKLPTRVLRFLGVFVAYAAMLCASVIWIPLAILVGFLDIWDAAK